MSRAGAHLPAACLQSILIDEREHRPYAERDLAVLEARNAKCLTVPVPPRGVVRVRSLRPLATQQFRSPRQSGQRAVVEVDRADGQPRQRRLVRGHDDGASRTSWVKASTTSCSASTSRPAVVSSRSTMGLPGRVQLAHPHGEHRAQRAFVADPRADEPRQHDVEHDGPGDGEEPKPKPTARSPVRKRRKARRSRRLVTYVDVFIVIKRYWNVIPRV